jgi:hypothetical protein
MFMKTTVTRNYMEPGNFMPIESVPFSIVLAENLHKTVFLQLIRLLQNRG